MCQNEQIKIVLINLDYFIIHRKLRQHTYFFKYCFKKNVIVNVETTHMLF